VKERTPLTRRQFMATLGLGLLGMMMLRLEIVPSTLKAVVPRPEARPVHMANLPMVREARLLVASFAVVAILGFPVVVLAASYGSDTYGGGPFNVGIDPPPLPPPASSGGGVVMGGPLGIGYVITNPTSSVAVVTSGPILSTSSLATSAVSDAHSIPANASRFSRTLRLLDTGADVQRLQGYLNANGFLLAYSGPGSPGHETQRFGALTYAALIKFQEAHGTAILAPLGLTTGTGFFGSSTITFIDEQP